MRRGCSVMAGRKEIVVIGAGFGGLSAAIRLLLQGHRVTLLEKRDQPGGRGYQYQVNGFKFDGGPTVIVRRRPDRHHRPLYVR